MPVSTRQQLLDAAFRLFAAKGFYGASLAGIALLRHVLFSPFGYAMRACRDSVLRSASIGIRKPAMSQT